MFFLFLFQLQIVSAQSSLKGNIVNELGAPISNVSVTLKGTQYGTVSDNKGFYSFNIPNGTYNVTTSLMGYKQETFKKSK